MEAVKEDNKVIQNKSFDMQRACGNGQHVLDNYICDTMHLQLINILKKLY